MANWIDDLLGPRIAIAGAELSARRATLNFEGGATAVDNPAADRIDITVTGAGAQTLAQTLLLGASTGPTNPVISTNGGTWANDFTGTSRIVFEAPPDIVCNDISIGFETGASAPALGVDLDGSQLRVRNASRIEFDDTRLSNVAAPVSSADAANKDYVDTEITAAHAYADSLLLAGIITESTTARTLAIGDAHKMIRCTNAAGCTITVPTNASVAFPVGTTIIIRQAAAGQVTVAAAGGVTINSSESYITAKQHASIAITKVVTNEWDMTGERELL